MKQFTWVHLSLGLFLLTAATSATAAPLTPAIVDSAILEIVGIEALQSDPALGLSYAELKPGQTAALSYYMHSRGRCGGFQALPAPLENASAFSSLMTPLRDAEVNRALMTKRLAKSPQPKMLARPELLASFDQVSAENQRKWVEYLSSFESRYHAQSNPNVHVEAVKARIQEIAKLSSLPITIDLITHRRTRQLSLRARIEGSVRPTEVVVLGGHLDSISGFFGRDRSPGADDNASGSANVLEAFRILSQMPRPDRSIEFYWYAGEEAGLFGSGEIAQAAKAANKDIIGVLQLDMTLHAGDGPFTLASMEDFTSPWLRQLLVEINAAYNLGARILADKCGYGCSDHASWYQQGYATLMPFESSFDTMNREIHTPRDAINSASNFNHSALFTKIALAFAWELASSTLREPKP